jgi:hypothetical protein
VVWNHNGDSNEVTQYITIDRGANQKPVCWAPWNDPDPILRVNGTKTIVLYCSDPDGDPITYSFDTSATRGTVGTPTPQPQPSWDGALPKIAVTYTAPADEGDGADSFSYTATDDRGETSDQRIVKNLGVRPPSYNTAPQCEAQRFALRLESGLPGWLPTACTDNENDPITYAVVSQPSHGHVFLHAADQQFEYRADPNYLGDDSFTYSATDDRGAAADPLPTGRVIVEARSPLAHAPSGPASASVPPRRAKAYASPGCKQLKARKRALCRKRAKCNSLRGRKKSVCVRRANAIGVRKKIVAKNPDRS